MARASGDESERIHEIFTEDPLLGHNGHASFTLVEKVEVLRHAPDQRRYPAGAVVFEEGEPGEVMYVILEGEVDILIGGECVETTRAGGVIGELALLDREPRSGTAVARTDCILAPVDARRFEFMVQQTPFFALHVMRIMAERLRRSSLRA